MVVNRLKTWWKNFKTNFATQTKVEKQVERKDTEDINEALDEDRGFKAGEAKREKRKRKSLENEMGKERDRNVSDYLHEQKEALQKKNYEDATSINKMIRIAENNEIECLSRNLQKKFGEFHDFWLMANGSIALVAKNEQGEPQPIAFGSDFTDILRNPAGLRKEVQNGILTLNVNKEGKPVESPEGNQVPDMIMGPNGDWTFTENYTEEYMLKVGDLKSTISSLRQQNASKEKAMVRMSNKIDEMMRDLEASEADKEAIRAQLDTRLEEFKNITDEFDSMQSQMSRMTQHKNMSETLVKEIVQKYEEHSEEIADRLDDDELDAKEDEIKRVLQLIGEMDDLNSSPEISAGGGSAEAGGNEE